MLNCERCIWLISQSNSICFIIFQYTGDLCSSTRLSAALQNPRRTRQADTSFFHPSNGHLEVIKVLLDDGAEVTVTDNDGWTPVNAASSNRHLEVVKLLLENGADIGVANNDGWTPLYSAASNCHLEVVKLLLNQGANISVVDKRGCTALHIAAEDGHVDVVKLLFQSLQASLHVQDNDGRTSLFFAATRGHSEVIRLLISYTALPNVNDRYGTSPLCAAIRNGHQEAVEILLSLTETTAEFGNGLDRNLAWWATKSGCASIIDLVRKWAQRMDIEICERDLTVGCYLVPFDRASRSCDVCTRCISSGCADHRCEVCHDFDICLECYGFGIQCRDASHDWILREPNSST
ncbi:unnamed protein product [Penicillium egyptiacum]|uniref:Uncharacterized protein n=1 Tax=Penicillium egyptiacum TaxID=1303716 RepID=A0A9W4KK63_9EURO|nr:unnamed protein product [Penicillium egyptiacum]